MPGEGRLLAGRHRRRHHVGVVVVDLSSASSWGPRSERSWWSWWWSEPWCSRRPRRPAPWSWWSPSVVTVVVVVVGTVVVVVGHRGRGRRHRGRGGPAPWSWCRPIGTVVVVVAVWGTVVVVVVGAVVVVVVSPGHRRGQDGRRPGCPSTIRPPMPLWSRAGGADPVHHRDRASRNVARHRCSRSLLGSIVERLPIDRAGSGDVRPVGASSTLGPVASRRDPNPWGSSSTKVKTQNRYAVFWASHCSLFSSPLVTPLPVHGTVANAAVGKMTHAIISSVAAVTAMRPAAVSRLLWFVLRSAGIFPTSIVLTASATGGHLCPPLAILGPRSGLLHPPKVPDCRKPFVLTFGISPAGRPGVYGLLRLRATGQPRTTAGLSSRRIRPGSRDRLLPSAEGRSDRGLDRVALTAWRLGEREDASTKAMGLGGGVVLGGCMKENSNLS